MAQKVPFSHLQRWRLRARKLQLEQKPHAVTGGQP
jgi:hypothetical protein